MRVARFAALAPLLAGATLLLVVAPPPLRAQASRDTTALPVSVITATRIPTPVTLLTASVHVLDGAALRREGVTHVGDALRRVPGLAIARTSSFGSQQALFLRGGQSNYVRVLVDGVPINEPGGVLDLGRLTLDDVERIEVVRGPASVLYGSEAMAGVIQILTRRGGGATRVNSEIGGGTYGARRASLGGSGGLGNDGALAWSLRGDHHASAGILPFNNGYRNDGAVGSLGVAAGKRSDIRLTARYNTSIYRYPTGSDGSVEDRNAERTEHRLLIGVDAERRWTDRVTSHVQLSAADHLPRTNDGADDAGDTLGFYGYFARGTVTRRMADVRTTLRLGDAQFVTLGTEVARDAERNRSVSQSEFGDFPDSFRAARDNRAVYAQVQGEVSRFTYTLGSRLDDNSAFGGFETVRAGAGWQLLPALRVRASAGTAFKAPSFFENFASGFTVGNPDLRPERSRSADLGLEVALPRGTSLRITGFTQRFRDLIQYTGAPPAGEPNYVNLAKANAGGVELEASLTLPGGFGITGGHTWTDTRVVDAGVETAPEANFVNGGRLLRRPDHVTTVQLTRSLAALGTLSALVVRTGEREDRSFTTWPATIVVLEPFTTVDLNAELAVPRWLLAGARLQLRVENAANTRYQQIADFDSPGRALYAGLKLER
ncbi:MAG: TonB-dependent receptor [Gemmatimonadaceae bacterium]